MSTVAAAAPRGKLLVLGGSGFAGARICGLALSQGWEVVSVSRRGAPSDVPPSLAGVQWLQGDATAQNTARDVLREGGFSAVFHAVGLLFEGSANRFVSGSGSVPSPGASYDLVTRRSALAAASAAAELCTSTDGGPPAFGFVSAAEAGWNFRAPVDWLERYLIAKRAVERELLASGEAGRLRPIILRPSLVWSADRPGSLPSVAAFYAANALGLPFVDRPVNVDTLAGAAVNALGDPKASGIFRYPEMEEWAQKRR